MNGYESNFITGNGSWLRREEDKKHCINSEQKAIIFVKPFLLFQFLPTHRFDNTAG